MNHLKLNLKLVTLPAMLAAVAGAAAATNNVPSQPGATKLPEMVVEGREDVPGALTVPNANQAERLINLTPGGVDVVHAEDFMRGRASTLKDVLEFSPGVFVQPRFGAEEARLSIRGSGIQRTFHGRGIKLLQDGVPLNLADGGFDFQAIEPFSTQYVEVWRGGNALRYGATTLGGAINYLSYTGHDAALAQARVEYGSFDYLRGQISSGHVQGPEDYYVSASHFSLDGFRDHSEQSTQRVFSNFGYKICDDAETRFYFTYVLTDSELPGNLTKAQLESNPRMANPGNVALDQKRDFELVRVANKTAWSHDIHRAELNTWWSHKDLDHPIFQVIDQNSNDLGADMRYSNNSEVFGHKNDFILGFMPTYGWVEDNRFLNVGGNRGARRGQSTQTSYNLDIYGENQFYIAPKLALVTGISVSYAARDFEDAFLSDGDQTDFQDWWGYNPKAGLRYDVTRDIQIYGNVSRSFEPPSFGELTRPPLGPMVQGLFQLEAQTATTVEVGTRGEHGRFGWDLTWYYSWVEDELLVFQLPPPAPMGATGTVNADDTIHHGIELGTTVRLVEGIFTQPADGKRGDQLLFRQAYQWNSFCFDNDPAFGDNRLAGIPEHFYRGELLYEHPCGFYGGPNVEWSPLKYPIDHANTFFADPYALVGFKIGYRARRGFSAFFEARNLTDKRYAATTGVIRNAGGMDTAQFLPGDGRAFYGGVEFKW